MVGAENSSKTQVCVCEIMSEKPIHVYRKYNTYKTILAVSVAENL